MIRTLAFGGSLDQVKTEVEKFLYNITDLTTFDLHYVTEDASFTAFLVQPFTGTGSTTFTGSGLDDGTFTGTFTGAEDAKFEVEIDATGTPDTYRWRKIVGGVASDWTEDVNLVMGAASLSDGVTITFVATEGHTLNDVWSVLVMADI